MSSGAVVAGMLWVLLSAPHIAQAQSDSTPAARLAAGASTYTIHGDTVRFVPNAALLSKMRNRIDTLKFMFRGDSAVVFTPLGPAAVSPAYATRLRRSMQDVDYGACLERQLSKSSHSARDLDVCTPLRPVVHTSGLVDRSAFVQHGDTIRWIRTSNSRSATAARSPEAAHRLHTDTMDFMFRGDSAVILRPHGPRAVSPFFASVLRKLMDTQTLTDRLLH
ncbi:MAG: hypothetical protein ABI194_03030 [Gemmatimonadaceae bacterium]